MRRKGSRLEIPFCRWTQRMREEKFRLNLTTMSVPSSASIRLPFQKNNFMPNGPIGFNCRLLQNVFIQILRRQPTSFKFNLFTFFSLSNRLIFKLISFGVFFLKKSHFQLIEPKHGTICLWIFKEISLRIADFICWEAVAILFLKLAIRRAGTRAGNSLEQKRFGFVVAFNVGQKVVGKKPSNSRLQPFRSFFAKRVFSACGPLFIFFLPIHLGQFFASPFFIPLQFWRTQLHNQFKLIFWIDPWEKEWKNEWMALISTNVLLPGKIPDQCQMFCFHNSDLFVVPINRWRFRSTLRWLWIPTMNCFCCWF